VLADVRHDRRVRLMSVFNMAVLMIWVIGLESILARISYRGTKGASLDLRRG